jgi:hypothetical protein
MEQKNKILRRAVLFTALGLALAALAVALIICKANKIVLFYSDLGVPYGDYYSEEGQTSSRVSEDMAVFDGRLYVGGGDYDANTGPIPVISRNLGGGKWELSEELLPDEQIKRFFVMDGKLVILGTDPTDDWSMGNYYALEGGAWVTHRDLPSGIHCFDAAKWGDETIFGLGVASGELPAVRFDGESYSAIEFFKDGAPLDTSAHEIVRVYNLFEFKNVLYAFLTLDEKDENGAPAGNFMELYAYKNGVFEFVSGKLPATDMPFVASDGERAYFIMNDTLLVTSDLMSFSAVSAGKSTRVSDIIKYDGEIFVLACRQSGESRFETMVFKVKNGSLHKEFGVFTSICAGAFTKDQSSFYISLGNRDSLSSPAHVGRVIKVTP